MAETFVLSLLPPAHGRPLPRVAAGHEEEDRDLNAEERGRLKVSLSDLLIHAFFKQIPRNLQCHICKWKYKHLGTLKRHLISKHSFFG